MQHSPTLLYISLEMNYYVENIRADLVKSALRRAAEKGRNIAKLWPERSKGSTHPIHHLHLFCVSSFGSIKDWEVIQRKCSHVLKLYQLRYDSSSNKLGLTDKMMDADNVVNKEFSVDTLGANDYLPEEMEMSDLERIEPRMNFRTLLLS